MLALSQRLFIIDMHSGLVSISVKFIEGFKYAAASGERSEPRTKSEERSDELVYNGS